MSSPTRPSTLVRSRRGGCSACGGGSRHGPRSGVLAIPPAQADPRSSPRPGSFTIRGAGFGHGWGMSQYGAYGAARKGLTWKQILAFYYPGTKLTTMAGGTMLRVWVTGDTDGSLRVLPATRPHRAATASAAQLQGADRVRSTSPGGSAVRHRVQAELPQRQRRTTSTSDRSVQQHLVVLQLGQDRPGRAAQRSVRPYRGSIALVKCGQQRPDRQPGASWRTTSRAWCRRRCRPPGRPTRSGPRPSPPARTRSGSGPTRSYAGYDLCDTTACQVYRGVNARDHPRERRRPGDRRHDRDLPRQRRPDPVRLLQRRAQRAGRLSVPRPATPTRTTA